MNNELQACIFDIQPYSIHDGPGIRTTIFFKGCPLHCLWCHNPESNEHQSQLMYYGAKCTGCGSCIRHCPKGAIYENNGKVATDRSLCTGCGQCSAACLYKAREVKGTLMTVDEVFDQAVADRMFFEASGGGVTVSGGEPLAQPGFVAALMKKLKTEHIHTAIETCGYASWENVKNVLANVDLVLYDLKAMDSGLHQRLTGVKNEGILSNIKAIRNELKKDVILRIPVVPGYNDSRENIEATAVFVKEALEAAPPIHLLPYHSLGDSKRESLENLEEPLDIRPPEDERMQEIKALMEKYGLSVQIGGAM